MQSRIWLVHALYKPGAGFYIYNYGLVEWEFLNVYLHKNVIDAKQEMNNFPEIWNPFVKLTENPK